tara:strand:- start:10862 stop:11209 length:348 start_codon:yes stop_codon:yes gene_type:complete
MGRSWYGGGNWVSGSFGVTGSTGLYSPTGNGGLSGSAKVGGGLTDKERTEGYFDEVSEVLEIDDEDENIAIFTPSERKIISEIMSRSKDRIENDIIGMENIIQHEREQTIKKVLK